MGEAVVTVFLAAAVVAYAVCGGADFGVGILELTTRPQDRPALRRAGERAIAPIWEANHIWIILALVIVFVGFPEVHVRLTTLLHVPLVLLLVGIVLRGTAFTFRYYDVGGDPFALLCWTVLFRTGSLLVPLVFGHLAASLARGTLTELSVDVWSAYMAPWVGPFPLAAGLLCAALFAWLAAVFLVGEADASARPRAVVRARLWTAATLLAGALTTAMAFMERVPWLSRALARPVVWIAIVSATVGVAVLWRILAAPYVWLMRVTAGFVVVAVLGGYWGAVYPVALELRGSEPLTWPEAAAPAATMDALALALVVAALLVVPGLVWLYHLFRSAPDPRPG